MAEFRMPSLGADMDEGTVVEWKVAPGDTVHRGDVIAVIETEKSNIDAEVFEDGVIGELLVPTGATVPVGTVLAVVAPTEGGEARTSPAEAVPPEPTAAPSVAAPTVGVVLSPVVRHLAEREGVDLRTLEGSGEGRRITRADVERAAPHPIAARSASGRRRASPRARRLAAARGIDLDTVAGSGPGGAVIGADVTARVTASPRPAPDEAQTRDRHRSMQRRIAVLMERSNRDIPHYWVTRDIDMGPAMAWLLDRNAGRPPNERMLPAALLLAATARAAAKAPTLNGHWTDGELHTAPNVELGVITALRTGGLLVPVIHDAARLTATATMAAMADLVRRARADHLRASDVSEPSITVSNLGDQGADEVLGVIYPPQVALVGFGRVQERAWVRDGMLGARPIVTASLAGDHRASDGHQASRFLSEVEHLLGEPELLEEVS